MAEENCYTTLTKLQKLKESLPADLEVAESFLSRYLYEDQHLEVWSDFKHGLKSIIESDIEFNKMEIRRQEESK